MANENQGFTPLELQKDILQRAGLEDRSELPTVLEASWGGETFKVGEVHPTVGRLIIFEIFQDAHEIRLYALSTPAPEGVKPQEKVIYNPTRITLTKGARSSVLEIMPLDVFADAAALELERLSLQLYPPPPPGVEEEDEDEDEKPKPAPKQPPAPAG